MCYNDSDYVIRVFELSIADEWDFQPIQTRHLCRGLVEFHFRPDS